MSRYSRVDLLPVIASVLLSFCLTSTFVQAQAAATAAPASSATVIARRHHNHRWVPFVAYGMAGAMCFSRITISNHFPADVFFGGAMGYVISRYAVLPARL
jgi:hypothetical protein